MFPPLLAPCLRRKRGREGRRTSVRTARDGDLVLGGVTLRMEVLGGPLEVIKDVLLLVLDAGEVPRFSVLCSSADVGDAV